MRAFAAAALGVVVAAVGFGQPARADGLDAVPKVVAFFGGYMSEGFTISSDVPDVAAYIWSFQDDPEVRWDYESSADIFVTPLDNDVPLTLRARLELTDGTLGPWATAELVPGAQPAVSGTSDLGQQALVGHAGTVTFSPHGGQITGYRYTMPDGVERTIDAAADGTATFDYTPAYGGNLPIDVTGLRADGTVTTTCRCVLYVSRPEVYLSTSWAGDWNPVGAAGEPGTFTFSTDLGEITTDYLWQVDDGPVTTTPRTGTYTTVSWTPDQVKQYRLTVRARYTDGTLSPLSSLLFGVGTTSNGGGTWG